jgi:hypothetical protein
MPANPDQGFQQSGLDDLTDAQVADLLNKAAGIKRSNPNYNRFSQAVPPPRPKEVDLTKWFGGIDD